MNWRQRKLSLSIFESTRALEPPDQRSQCWDDIVDFLANRPPTAAHKEHLKLFKLLKMGNTPNPGGKGSYRWNGNVVHVSGVLAEYDAGTVTLDDAAERLQAAGLAAFLYTTPSHMQDGKGHRWRVMLPLSVDFPFEQHNALVDKVNGALGGILAPESWVLTQPMYYGKVSAPGVVYETREVRGEPLDLVAGIAPLNKKGETPVQQPPVLHTESVQIDTPANLQWIRDILAKQDPDMSEPEWWKMGARISHHTGHSEEGYQLFDSWSAGSLSKYDGAEATRKKWDEIGSRADQSNPATFGALLREQTASDDAFGPPLSGESLDILGDLDAAQKAKFAITPIKLSDFITRDPPKYLIAGLIESSQLFALIGKRKGGKSYAALEMSYCVAQGRPYAGHEVVDSGPVLWIAAEGARSLREHRGPQWHAHYGDADIRVWPKPLNMRKQETYEGLLETCRGIKLVIIDSLRRVTPGAKENSSDELGEVLAYAEQLALETGAAVGLIAHASNKSTAEGAEMTARGSSVIEDQVEAGFMVEKIEAEGEPTYFRVTPGFARDEETGDAAALFYKLKPIAPPGIAPGVIIEWITREETPARGGRRAGQGKWHRAIRLALGDVAENAGLDLDTLVVKAKERVPENQHSAEPRRAIVKALASMVESHELLEPALAGMGPSTYRFKIPDTIGGSPDTTPAPVNSDPSEQPL